MAGYETRTSQLGLVSGRRQAASDLVTVVEPGSFFAPEARKGRLYIVVEADPQAVKGRDACQLVTQTVRKVFYDHSSYSVTSALRDAMRAANSALYQHNFRAPAHQRAYVGLTCAVIKGGDLFIAQVAPAQAYVLAGGKLRALPAHPSWDPAHISATPFVKPGSLGLSLFVEPELYRSPLHPGDSLAICSSNFAHLLSRAEVEELLRYQDPAAATENLYNTSRQRNLSEAHALVIEVLPPLSPAARSAPLSPTSVGERGRLAWRAVGDWLANLTGEVALVVRGRGGRPGAQAHAPDQAAPRPDPLRTLPAQPNHSPAPPPRPRPIDVGESLAERYEREQRSRPGSERRMPPSTYLGEEGYAEQPALKRIDLSDTPALAASARPYRPRYELRPLVDMTWGERLAVPFRLLGAAAASRIRARRVAPPPMPVMRGQGLSYRRQKAPFPWLQLLILTLLVTSLILYGINLSRRSAQQTAIDYLGYANERMAAVREAPDDTAALERLELARQAIDEVRASPLVTVTNPTLWLGYQELLKEYERALAAIQRLTFFEDPEELAVHPLPNGRFASVIVPRATSATTSTTLIEIQRYIYALDADRENARLYRIPREGGAAEAYLSPNQAVQSTVVGPLRAQAWREDQVVVVDQAPSSFGYYFRSEGDWNYSRLGGSEVWAPRGRLDLETYGGNLYVWGAEPNEVLKFTTGSYADPPQLWLNPNALNGRDLSAVIDMAVDGNIYLLQSDGKILVFSAGQMVGEIIPGDLTPAITAVTRFAVVGPPEGGWIFLLDTLNERVIQLEKTTGKVLQQIEVRPESGLRLDQLTDLFVDDSGSRPVLYLVNGGQIIRAALPQPPQPFRQPNATPTRAP